MDLPLVSVIMPAYNVEAFIGEAIESLLAQTYPRWEVIVVDDGSTDGTRAVIERYQARDARIKPIYSKHFGRGRARNLAVDACTGCYVAMLDADDVTLPHRFERQVAFLESHPDVGVVSGQCCSFVDEAKVDMGKLMSWPNRPEEIAAAFRKRKMKILNGAAMLRRELFSQFGGYKEALLRAQDYEFFLRLSLGGVKMSALDEVLLLYRQANLIPTMSYFVDSELYRHYANALQNGETREFSDWSASRRGGALVMYTKLKYFYLYAKLAWAYRDAASPTKATGNA